MRKNLLFLITVLFCFQSLTAQQDLEENEVLREVFADGEFFFASEDYRDALVEYLKLYKRGFSDNANLNYKIGICYLNIPGQKEKSIEHFEKATEKVSDNYRESSLREKNAPFDTYLFLGNAYRVTNQLDKAIEAYSKYKEFLKKDDVLNLRYANQQIEAAKNAKTQMQDPLDVEIVVLGRPVNNNSDNFRGVVSGDHKTMVYMNALPFYDALYHSDFEDGEWSTPTNITPQVQSDGNQYATAMSYDGDVLYLSWEDPFNSDIYVSEFEDGRWTKSRSIGSEINTKFWESHASVSRDGKTLYFASNRQESEGEMDIFMSTKQGNKWTEPENLGKVINTNLNEDTPFVTPDGNRLYFSSQGHSSIGGYDIFYSDLQADGTWSEPQNLGYPINSTDDDLFYVPVNQYQGYMARYLESGNGGIDIIRFDFPGLPEEELAQTEPEQVQEIVEDRVEAVEDAVEEDTEEQIEKVMEGADDEIFDEPVTAKDQQDITEETVPAQTEDELNEEIQEEVAEITETEEEIITEEEKAEKRRFEIRPIFFEFDKANLTQEAKAELDEVANLLKEDNTVEIRLIGFADILGDEQYNVQLSKRRAQSALDYISQKGIDAQRVETTGKGASDFIAINKNPDGTDNPRGRRYNRRVEIHFENTDDAEVIVIKPEVVPDDLKNK